MYKIPLSVPTSNGNELQYVKECIDTEWATSAGNNVTLFKEKMWILREHSLVLIYCKLTLISMTMTENKS